MHAREITCAAARAPLLRNKINVVHNRPGEEGKEVGAENEKDVVSNVSEVVGLCGWFHISHDTGEIHSGKRVDAVGQHGARELM